MTAPPLSARVAVLLPVRDGASTLPAALASLSAQTLPAFDVVIVDDGSRDETAAVAEAWIADFAAADGRRPPNARRAQLLRTPPKGIVAALERGLAEIRAPFTARMDGDDVAHPDRLAAQLAHLDARPELAGCGTGVRMTPESGVSERAAEYAAWLNGLTSWSKLRRDLFVECPLAHPTFMFRTEALRSVGGYRDLGWPEDYDLLLRLWRAGRRFAALPQALLDWTARPGRASRTHPAYSLDAFRRCRVHHLRRSLLAGRPGGVVWGSGPTGKALAKEFLAQGVRVLGFVDVAPRKIGQHVHGALVRSPAGAGRVKEFAGALHVGAVARSQGRASVREAAAAAGLEDGKDFVAMA